MTLFEALERDQVVGVNDRREQTIETVISRVFLYPTEARKVYKHENGFVGDLRNDDFRRRFVREDFVWNHAMCPEIYRRLDGARLVNDRWELCPTDRADDFIIVMQRVDVAHNLYHQLRLKLVTAGDVEAVASTMLRRLISLTAAKRNSIETFKRSWRELYLLRLKDLREWCRLDGANVEPAFLDKVVSGLESLQHDPHIANFRHSDMHVAIDNHAGNILVTPDGVEFLDIYQFKEHWLAVDPLVNITRPAVDILVLGSETLLHSYLNACQRLVPLPDKRIVIAYLIDAAMIMVAYRNMLNEPDVAAQYVRFIERRLPEIS